MKKYLLWISLVALMSVLSSCDEKIEEPYTITFDDESIASIEAYKNETIELPTLEHEDGFFLGWEDTSGSIYKTKYTVEEDMTLRPVFELLTDVLELSYDDEDNTVRILAYTGQAPYVKIPHKIDDYIVRSIGMEAFAESTPTRIDIPMTVYSIGIKAFSNMPNLKELHYYGEYLGTFERNMDKATFDELIDANMVCQSTSMEQEPTEENPWIFEDGCPILKVTEQTPPVTGPDGQVYTSYYVHQPASEAPPLILHQHFDFTSFIGSEQLLRITLPNKLSVFDPEAFDGLPNLEALSIENNPFIYSSEGVIYEKETDNLLYYPSGLMGEHFVIPDHITHINTWALANDHTETITLQDTTTFEPGAFANLKGLKDIDVEGEHPLYTIVDGVVYSKDQTSLLFYPAGKEARRLTLSNTVTTIEQYAFMNQQHLEHIVIPEGVKYIFDSAFLLLPSLEKVDIASSVEVIHMGNFVQHENTLKTIIIRKSDNVLMAPAINIKITEDLEIYIPDELMTSYEKDMWWQYYKNNFVPLSELEE